MRAVNQAVGRVIRHSSDYGAIVLADQRLGSKFSFLQIVLIPIFERFALSGNQNGLSLWLRPQLKVYNQFGVVSNSVYDGDKIYPFHV